MVSLSSFQFRQLTVKNHSKISSVVFNQMKYVATDDIARISRLKRVEFPSLSPCHVGKITNLRRRARALRRFLMFPSFPTSRLMPSATCTFSTSWKSEYRLFTDFNPFFLKIATFWEWKLHSKSKQRENVGGRKSKTGKSAHIPRFAPCVAQVLATWGLLRMYFWWPIWFKKR